MRTPPRRFFVREPDGGVTLRLRFTREELDNIEDASETTPVVTWIHKTVAAAARAGAERNRERRQALLPPPAGRRRRPYGR